MNTNNGWLDIASAPKDGTEIIVFHPEGGVCAAFCPGEGFAWHCMDGMNTVIGKKSRQSIPVMTSFIEPPTHWMPLPAAPGSPTETPAYTVTVDPDPRGVSVGVYLGSSCVCHGAHAIPAGAVADESAKDERQEVETDSFDDPSALSAVADALADDTSNDNAQFAAAYLYRQARALIEAPAAGDARAWQRLTDAERDGYVGELVDYGTDFVAPLYSVVESIEKRLREKNTASQQGGE